MVMCFVSFEKYTGTLSINTTNRFFSIICKYILIYGVSRGNVPVLRRMFLKLKYTNITQNTSIQS